MYERFTLPPPLKLKKLNPPLDKSGATPLAEVGAECQATVDATVGDLPKDCLFPQKNCRLISMYEITSPTLNLDGAGQRSKKQ